ncbi:ABC transporter permease [Candidatus Micrarchaeota archaeon]|nr:ABC transporter permease [Candidatus Micrarchaeota archaeon]
MKDDSRMAHPSALKGAYAVWWRETTVFFREPPRIISAVVSPIIWLVIFGAGLGESVRIGGESYQQFIFGGVLVQTFLFSSLFYGAYLVWDRKIDVLKAVLVSPLSRSSIFLGKVLGGVTISLIESVIVLLVGAMIGMQYSPATFFIVLGLVALASAGLTALGLIVGSYMESPEGFQLLGSLVLFPMFFLSGALFPISNLTGPLGLVAALNPVTYIVDLLRGALSGVYYLDPAVDAVAFIGFIILANVAGVLAFERMKS